MPQYMLEPMRQHLASLPVRGREQILFPALDGISPIASSVLCEAHDKGRRSIKRPTLWVHDLRKTGATMAAQQGATVKELMALLGHTTPDMAMRYQVATKERDRQRADRLDEALNRAI